MKRIGDGVPLKINVILILYQLHNYLRNRRRLGKHKAGIIYVICVSVVNILLPESSTVKNRMSFCIYSPLLLFNPISQGGSGFCAWQGGGIRYPLENRRRSCY